MNREPKGSYTKEFREQVVKLVLVDGLSQLEAARRLSLSNKTPANWVSEGAISGTGEEHGPDRNAVRAGQSLDGTQEAVKRMKDENAAYGHSEGRQDATGSGSPQCEGRHVLHSACAT